MTAKKQAIWLVGSSSCAISKIMVDEVLEAWNGLASDGNGRYGYRTKKEAIAAAKARIEKAELLAHGQLLNAQRHRLYLEHSIRMYENDPQA